MRADAGLLAEAGEGLMPGPTLHLYLDQDDDLSFGESLEDIAAFVNEVTVKLGIFKAGEHLADACEMTMTLDNSTGLFSPEAVTAKALTTGRYVRLTATYSAVTYNVFTGLIEYLRADELGTSAEMRCYGRLYNSNMPVDFALQLSVQADDIITLALASANWRQAQIASSDGLPYLLLDVTGKSELDSARLWPDLHDVSLEAGVSTFDYIGDIYATSPTLRQLFHDLAWAELGYIFENQDGALVFLNRDHVATHYASQASYTGVDGVASLYTFGEGVINRVRVRLLPRTVSASYTLWTSVNAMTFQQGKTSFVVRFRDAANRPIGVSGDVSKVAWSFKDGVSSGTDFSAQVGATLTPLANGVKVEVANESGRTLYLQVGAMVLGTAILIDDPLEIEAINQESRAVYGERFLGIDIPLYADVGVATDFVNFLALSRGAALAQVRKFSIQNDTAGHLTEQLGRHLFDVVTLTLTGLEHAGSYFIVGIEHKFTLGGMVLVTTFYLEPFSESGVLILDVDGLCELDSRILGF